MTAKELLVEARAIVDAHWEAVSGYGSRNDENVIVRCCLVGGLTAAAEPCAEWLNPSDKTRVSEKWATVITTLRDLIPAKYLNEAAPGTIDYSWPVEDWNDEDNRTKEEVLALIDQAIERLS